MTFIPRHKKLLDIEDVKRWYAQMTRKSPISADVWLRRLGLYCEIMETSPTQIVKDAEDKKNLRRQFEVFVEKMEKDGKLGSYIVKFRSTINSWLKYNYSDYKLDVPVAHSEEYPTVEKERVPTKEELTKILRESKKRGRVSISLMAFAGLRPESLGNYEGTDGLKLGDLPDLVIGEGKVSFQRIPSQIIVRKSLSKARISYNTFLGEQGCDYITEYLNERIAEGEILSDESPLLQLVEQNFKTHKLMRTLLVARDIREAIVKAGFKLRPYVLRSYFATAMDISESKGLISHAWRQHFMGHKGDIETTYSTNKRLLPEMIDEMRNAYSKCVKYLETNVAEVSEDNAKKYLQEQLLLAVGYKQTEIDKMELDSLDNEQFQELLKSKVVGTMTGNGSKQKVVREEEIEEYIEKGYEFQSALQNGKAVMKLPF